MNAQLDKVLEILDAFIANSIDQLEDITPTLEADKDAFIADDIRELLEDIRGIINE